MTTPFDVVKTHQQIELAEEIFIGKFLLCIILHNYIIVVRLKKYVELLLQQIEISKKNNCVFPICFYPKEEGRKETNPIGYYFVTHNSHPLVHNNIPLKVQIFSSKAATEKC